MTPDALLRPHPRETLRWLRRRLGLSQLHLADVLDVSHTTVSRWETQHHARSPRHRAQLAARLAPHLATPAEQAVARSLGRGEAAGGA